MKCAPRWCHHDDPDEQFDEFSGCHWLPAARLALTSGIDFVLLSLHRPYIFSMAESRTEALTAALKILIAQRRLFHLSAPQQYISFNMVYPLFDAMVIALATIVLFPNENLDIHPDLVQNIRWAIDMLSKIGEHSAMARTAYSVVKKLFSRLDQSGGHALKHSSHTSNGVTEHLGTETTDPDRVRAVLNLGFPVDNVNAELLSPICPQMEVRALDSPNFHFETSLPPQPIHDLFYQDSFASNRQGACQATDICTQDPEFDIHYPDSSFWTFVNNFSPS